MLASRLERLACFRGGNAIEEKTVGNRIFDEIANLMRPRHGSQADTAAGVGESNCWSADSGSGLRLAWV